MFEQLIAVVLAVGLDRLNAAYSLIDPVVWVRRWAQAVAGRFGGSRAHGVLAVLVALVPIVLLVLVARYVLGELAWFLRFVFDVIVLAWCLDLYRLTDRAEEVAEALKAEDLPVAGEHLRLLAESGAEESTEGGIARAAVETVLRKCSALVIAPVFWFVLLGPVGAVLQRSATVLRELWARGQEQKQSKDFAHAAAALDEAIGWIPARLTAISYAIMGSFEDALRCWRYQAGIWLDGNGATLLAAGLGALQLRSCEGLADSGRQGPGVAVTSVVPDASHVQRVIALVWRVLLFWLGLALLIVLTGLPGV